MMPLISFPKNNGLINAGQARQKSGKPVPQSLPLFDAGTQTKKNELLIEMLNNLASKDIYEIHEYCIKSLQMISLIVKAGGNREEADTQLIKSKLSNEYENLLSLFDNRDTGLFGRQNINRTAAKYVEVLRQILQTIDGDSFTRDLDVADQKNLNILREESNKWYRGSYIGGVKVSITKYKLNIQLGRQNGTMGSVHKLELDIPIALVDQIVTVKSETIEINYELLFKNCFEHNTKSQKISEERDILDGVLKKIRRLDLNGKYDNCCQGIIIKCLIQNITQTINNNGKTHHIYILIDSYHSKYLSNLSKLEIIDLLIDECISLDTNLTLSTKPPFYLYISYQIANNRLFINISNSNEYASLWSKIVTNAMKLATTTVPADQIGLLVQQHARYISIQSLNKILVNSDASNIEFIEDNVMKLFNSFIIQDTSEADVFTLNSKKHTQVSLFLELLTNFGTKFIGVERLKAAYDSQGLSEYYKNLISKYLIESIS